MTLDRLKRSPDVYKQEIIEVLLFHEVARVQRYPVPLSLLRMTVQHNRQAAATVTEGVNLIVSHVLNANLRIADIAGHYGDDYLVILPVTEEAGALSLGRRLTKLLFGTHPFRSGGQIELVTFVGVATFPQGAQVAAIDCLDQVEAALTEARRRAPGAIVTHNQLGKTGPLQAPS
jgi:hypothetical protein